MRGSVCYISRRYNKANKKYLRSYDPKKPTKYLTYLDKNNLYCYAMSKSLPMGSVKWWDCTKFNLDKYDNSLRRCALEVDFEYPKELHELHNDYPLAPDKLETKREMLSDCQLKTADNHNISIGNAKKMVPNFLTKYVCASLQKLPTLYKTRIKNKKSTSCIRIWSIEMAKNKH